jgi:hypothetical protein
METIGNIVVGKPDVEPSRPSHSRGVREGNLGRALIRVKRAAALVAQAAARRSTGINARGHEPIDPRMPILTPA